MRIWRAPTLRELRPFFKYVSAEGPGHFRGTAARRLGVWGRQVTFAALLNLARQRSADGLERLGRKRPFLGHRFLLLEPKSTLILPLWRPDTEQPVAEARDAALDVLVRDIEATCGWTRRGAGGTRLEHGRGLLFCVWNHFLSRAGEPAPHIEVLWLNTVWCQDDRWRAVAGIRSTRAAKAANARHASAHRSPLFAEQSRLGAVYRDAFRVELERRGLRTRNRADFGFELADVPERLIRHFSTRRREVLTRASELRGKHGERVPEHRLLQWAAHSSRAEKPSEIDLAATRERWLAEALRVEPELVQAPGSGRLPLNRGGIER